jgi:formate-dependent nitrite reductase membrane component NrfD
MALGLNAGFNAEFKSQREFGWLLSIWLFLGGTGCGLFVLSKVLDLPIFFALLGLGSIVLGGVVLLLELGSPTRAWRGVLRIRTSWLSRGVVMVGFFVVTGFLSVAPAWVPGLPWEGAGLAGRALGWIAALCALMIVLYPGFWLAKNRSIPFWNTAWLPAILVCYAATGASAMILLGSAYLKAGLRPYDSLAAVLIVATCILVGAYLLAMHSAGGAARESVRLLNAPPLNWTFRLGVILVGLLLPLVLILWVPAATVLAGLCMLVGGFLFRYCVLKVGVYVPPALVQEGMDFSRLNRTGTDLEREYAGMAAQRAGGRG